MSVMADKTIRDQLTVLKGTGSRSAYFSGPYGPSVVEQDLFCSICMYHSSR